MSRNIDMPPAATYIVRIEESTAPRAMAIEDFLGEAVGNEINAFEIVSRPTGAKPVFSVYSRDRDHEVEPTFATSEATITAMINRIRHELNMFQDIGHRNITLTRAAAKRICGMLDVLDFVCDASSLQTGMRNELKAALQRAAADFKSDR